MKTLTLFLLLALPLGNAALAAGEPDETPPFMVDKNDGWKMNYTDTTASVMRTTDGGKNWTDVSPPALTAAIKSDPEFYDDFRQDITALSPLDKQRAWLAVIVKEKVKLEYTSSGGRDWREIAGPGAMEGVSISFLDDQTGFILDSSDPAAGTMKKSVFGTQDGGRHWAALGSPELEATSYYTTGISFCSSKIGWVTGTYHGAPDAPLFRTEDGGKSWQMQTFEIPADYRGGYADTNPPVFIGADRKRGYLPVKLVRHDPPPGHITWVNYETDDGGQTWHLPASGVQSVPDE